MTKKIEPKPIIKDVYKMPNVDQLIEQNFSLHMGSKYDEVFREFYEASGYYMYLPLGDKLREWSKNGEGEQVKILCTFLYKFFQNRKALLYEIEKFFSEDEKAELKRIENRSSRNCTQFVLNVEINTRRELFTECQRWTKRWKRRRRRGRFGSVGAVYEVLAIIVVNAT